jgi:hypothetical protein
MGDCYDMPEMLASLDLETDAVCPKLAWLEESRLEPDRFFDGVFQWMQLKDRGLRTRRQTHYELYLDLVERHCGSNSIALLAWERKGMVALTFDELATRALRCAEAWSKHGVVPGVRVALALPFGGEYLIAFCALLCLGANVVVVDPGPPKVTASQVRISQATLMVRAETSHSEPALDGVVAIRVMSEGTPRTVRPHAYQPEGSCWFTFSPLSNHPGRPVSARGAFDAALLDAIFALRLDVRARLAAPGWSLRQYQPNLIVACLVTGCTFVHLTLEQLRANPNLLVEANVTCLGLSHGLLSAFGETPRPLATVEHLVRPIDEPLHWSAYRDFLRRTELHRVPCSSLLMDSAIGGSALFSPRLKGIFTARVLPSIGRRFSLKDASTGETDDRISAGVFQVETESNAAMLDNGSKPASPEAFLLLARNGTEWFYGGTSSPRRGTHCYPIARVIDCVEQISGVTGACVVPVPEVTAQGFWTFCLLLFVESVECGPTTVQVEAVIGSELGAEAIPDRVELIPFAPRRVKGKVDTTWYECRYQASRLGGLFRSLPYRTLSALRARLMASNPD